jgi:heat shock protein HtpX
MLQPLSRETVLDAQRSTRRATWRLFTLLLGIYVFFFHLLAVGAVVALAIIFTPRSHDGTQEYIDLNRVFVSLHQNIPLVILGISVVALLTALAQFWIARRKNIYDVLMLMGGKLPDTNDQIHIRFRNIVEEAEIATGIRPIQANVISSVSCNAFSIMDKYGNAAIGVTEGLISTLSRPELSAVIAHEACHLVHGDTFLKTTACSLFSVFEKLQTGLAKAGEATVDFAPSSRNRGDGDIRTAIGIFILWCIAALGAFCTNLISMAISREREYLADAHAAQMCLDPLSLADALRKISTRYRGGLDFPAGYSALFVMNPSAAKRDESVSFFSNLFSTHPPMEKRVERLLEWAHLDETALKPIRETALQIQDDEAIHLPTASPVVDTQPLFFVKNGESWVGPHTPLEMVTLGLVKPGAWIAQSDQPETLQQAGYNPVFLALFKRVADGLRADDTLLCPHCQMPLVEKQYKYAPALYCPECEGWLLKSGIMERIISRRLEGFTPAQIEEAKIWGQFTNPRAQEQMGEPEIKCPVCQARMKRNYYSLCYRVVVDRCASPICRSIWLDKGELETIQILVEQAEKTGPLA